MVEGYFSFDDFGEHLLFSSNSDFVEFKLEHSIAVIFKKSNVSQAISACNSKLIKLSGVGKKLTEFEGYIPNKNVGSSFLLLVENFESSKCNNTERGQP
ncbi:hypothetical protein [Aliikangiella maris]|uniref:Uncharacterized protein n=2 Tax=Aliikangiella maris TaxID=3162458 RepID=A0ABV3MVG0_9GAMM